MDRVWCFSMIVCGCLEDMTTLASFVMISIALTLQLQPGPKWFSMGNHCQDIDTLLQSFKRSSSITFLRLHFSSQFSPQKMFIFGGCTSFDGATVNQLQVFDFGTSTWNTIAFKKGPSPRASFVLLTSTSFIDHFLFCVYWICSCSLLNIGNFLYLFGGLDYKNEKAFNDLHCFSVDNQTWTEADCKGTKIQPRFSHVATSIENRMYVYGG